MGSVGVCSCVCALFASVCTCVRASSISPLIFIPCLHHLGAAVEAGGVMVDWAWFGAARVQRSRDVYLDHFHRSRILRANEEDSDLNSSPRKRLRRHSRAE